MAGFVLNAPVVPLGGVPRASPKGAVIWPEAGRALPFFFLRARAAAGAHGAAGDT